MSKDVDEAVAAVFHILAMILVGMLAFIVASWLTMVAWNWSMPYLFALPEASYRSACGLTLLAWVAKVLTIRISKE